MAEKYRFFDAVEDEFGVYDREYNAQEFTDYFKALVTTGVMNGAGNQLAVTANGSNMITKVDTGIAFILGRYYENDSFKELTHDTETLGNSRIDRIVVRMDLSTEARCVKTFVKKGAPSTNPVAPTLTQTQNLYEISLAQVRVVGGQTFIATNAVTDERGIDVICPWAGSNILPNFNEDGLAELIGKIEGSNVSALGVSDLNDVTEVGLYSYDSPSMLNKPTGIFPKIGEIYIGDILTVHTSHTGAITQTVYRISNGFQRYPTVYNRGYYGGVWGPWAQTATSVNIQIGYRSAYVDGLTGDDTNPGTQELPFKTISGALQYTSYAANRLDIFLKGGQRYEGTTQILNKHGAAIQVRAYGGLSAPIISWLSVDNIDRFILEGVDLLTGGTIENCPNFLLKNVNKTTTNSNHGIKISRSTGTFESVLSSGAIGTNNAGYYIEQNSVVYMYYAQGGNNTIGIYCNGSIVRKGAGTAVTGTTAQKLENGGQIV